MFQAGPARKLVVDVLLGAASTSPGWLYDVTADGQRFLVSRLSEEAVRAATTVVINWTEALPKE